MVDVQRVRAWVHQLELMGEADSPTYIEGVWMTPHEYLRRVERGAL